MNTHDPIVGRYVYVQCEGKTYRTYYEEQRRGHPNGSPAYSGHRQPAVSASALRSRYHVELPRDRL